MPRRTRLRPRGPAGRAVARPGRGPSPAILEARPAEYGTFPDWLDPRIVVGLTSRGIERPYTHQAEAIEATRAGEDVVVVTPTASGKTLCYALPILQAIADDAARALLLFPTKALGQDQVTEFAELSRAAGLPVSAATYDAHAGPDPVGHPGRRAGRRHQPGHAPFGELPHHTKSYLLFEQLRYIVIDELHTYRGVFGGHVANVLRRLLRNYAHYGSHPVIVCCSATIGIPGELAEALTGRSVRVIDRTGAPTGKRHVLLVDPAAHRRRHRRPGAGRSRSPSAGHCRSCAPDARRSCSVDRGWRWNCC